MRYDDLPSPADEPPERAYPQLPVDRADPELPAQPLADREVPLANWCSTFVPDQWLDGEVSVVGVRAASGGNDALDLWNKINDEAELLRNRKTPLYVHKRIMESLPDDMYQLNEPWYRRPIHLSPLVILGIATALVGIGALVAKLVIH